MQEKSGEFNENVVQDHSAHEDDQSLFRAAEPNEKIEDNDDLGLRFAKLVGKVPRIVFVQAMYRNKCSRLCTDDFCRCCLTSLH